MLSRAVARCCVLCCFPLCFALSLYVGLGRFCPWCGVSCRAVSVCSLLCCSFRSGAAVACCPFSCRGALSVGVVLCCSVALTVVCYAVLIYVVFCALVVLPCALLCCRSGAVWCLALPPVVFYWFLLAGLSAWCCLPLASLSGRVAGSCAVWCVGVVSCGVLLPVLRPVVLCCLVVLCRPALLCVFLCCFFFFFLPSKPLRKNVLFPSTFETSLKNIIKMFLT